MIDTKKTTLKWVWQKQPIELTKLDDGQLYTIRDALVNSNKKKWFNINTKVWLKEVNHLIRVRNIRNTEEVKKQIIERRMINSIPTAKILADAITDFIVHKIEGNHKNYKV